MLISSSDSLTSIRKLLPNLASILLKALPANDLPIVLQVLLPNRSEAVDKYAEYLNDPVRFAHEILNVKFLTPAQEDILKSLLNPPYCTLCPSANNLGKSMISAVAVIWWFCTRSPCIIITTATNERQVKDVLWKEIRKLSRKAKLNLPFLPKACRIERAADDFAWGGTARDATGFQGHHGPNIFIVFDEATGIAPEFWEAAELMFKPPGHAWLCPFNPTDPSSRVYTELAGASKRESRNAKQWHVVRMSALDHPNLESELKGESPPVPDAMGLETFNRLFRKWSQLVGCEVGDMRLQLATDIVWPPVWAVEYCQRTRQFPKVWRPGPLAEARLLGRFPRAGVNNVWSDGDWMAATREGGEPLPLKLEIPEIGCDVAAMGDDNTAIHVRMGWCSLYHEEKNGQNEVETKARLQELAVYYAHQYNQMLSEIPEGPRQHYGGPITKFDVPIKVDCDGLGGTLSTFLEADGYKVVRVGAGTKAMVEKDYPNRRSELWFQTAEMARDDNLDLSRLPEEVLDNMRKQCMRVVWSFDNRGRRHVMPKSEMKLAKNLGCSPDSCDALNLAYAPVPDHMGADEFPMAIKSRTNPLTPRNRQPAR